MEIGWFLRTSRAQGPTGPRRWLQDRSPAPGLSLASSVSVLYTDSFASLGLSATGSGRNVKTWRGSWQLRSCGLAAHDMSEPALEGELFGFFLDGKRGEFPSSVAKARRLALATRQVVSGAHHREGA